MSARGRMGGIGVALLAGGALTGCLDVADARARRDAEVGQAASGGLAIAVDEGLAAVRLLAPDRIVLWGQAPSLGLTLTIPPGTPTLSLTFDNALPDAVLSAPEGPPGLALVPEPTLVATQRRYQLLGLQPGPLRLVLAPPDANASTPFRFAVFADVQEAIGRVQDLYRRMNQDETLRFVVMSGDLTESGSEAELTRFQREMQGLGIPIFATLGNHELGVRDTLFHEHFGRGNFRFAFHGVQFTLLDSASATLAPQVYGWLDTWLVDARDRLHFVFMHIPPLDPVGARNGAFASRLEAAKLISLLAAGGVDLTIYGHVHSYYAFSNGGIPAFVTGGGGAIPERLDGLGRHYLVVSVDPTEARLETSLVRIE